MAIAQRGTATSAQGTSSVTVNIPAGVVNDDQMILLFGSDGNTMTTLSGWTLVQNNNTPNTGKRMAVFIRKAASEPASYTINPGAASNTEAMIVAFSGCDTTTAQDAASSQASAFVSITYNSITTVTDNAMHVLCVVDWTNATGITTPTGYTQTGVSTLRCIAKHKLISPAGVVSGVTSTGGGNDGIQVVMALRPAGAAAVTYAPSRLGSSLHPGKTMNAMARFMQTKQGIVPVFKVVFRKTLSGIGTRTGSRQTHH